MRTATRDRLAGLTRLHRLGDRESLDAAWRQGMATLARTVIDQRRPIPLEGLDPDALLKSIEHALEEGLIDELDWLSPPAAGAALYEVAAALPNGPCKRQLGRIVFHRLQRGDATTFVALATRLALGAQRALGGRSMRARVALALHLPIGSATNVDPLALALISRQDLSREWLTEPSTGSLPSRRLAACLLERAAREAARRAAVGDDSGVRVFCTPAVRDAWDRLLADRESLVWRHVASARGLLVCSMPVFQEEIRRHLDPDFTITEWRRAAASLASSIAVEPEQGLAACRALLDSVIFQQDHGIAAEMITGLRRAAESHPEVAESLLEQLVRVDGIETAEALLGLRRERVRPGFGDRAARRAEDRIHQLIAAGSIRDQGRIVLMNALADELGERHRDEQPTLSKQLDDALNQFAEHGASAAAARAGAILEATATRVRTLEECLRDGIEFAPNAFLALRELDATLFESDTLSNLLQLDPKDGTAQRPEDHRLGDLFQRISNWLLIREGDPPVEQTVPQYTARLRQLRSLLHLVDADGPHVDTRQELVRQRRLVVQRVLLSRGQRGPKDPLRRALFAATARTCDALVREDIVHISDIVVATASRLDEADGLRTMAEASMLPELKTALSAYCKFHETTIGAERRPDRRALRSSLDALRVLANRLPVARSARVEALRSALLRLGKALRDVASSGSLSEVSEQSAGRPLADLEEAVGTLAQLVSGAQRRLGSTVLKVSQDSSAAVRGMGREVERALRSSVSEIDKAYATAAAIIHEELPGAFGTLTAAVLRYLRTIPLDGPRRTFSSAPAIALTNAVLPGWVPPSRVLGGFHLIRSVGTGAVGSVFVAKRVEARQDEDAVLFALKVPDYSAAAARTLSEEEFLRLFREEAGTLLALPEHQNIAHFVTFDAGARPKPILVMELVEGPSLERLLEMRDLSTRRATELLLGVSAGLQTMHDVGIGHLDVKPSNIIVRTRPSNDPAKRVDVPVLVDFGLAGKHLRPGCGTANYGAPEIWGLGGDGPIAADVYAFGCLVFELYTGQTLFDGVGEAAMITMHVAHDGDPEPVQALQARESTRELGELVAQCLRRNPADRIGIAEARERLEKLAPTLGSRGWPLPSN